MIARRTLALAAALAAGAFAAGFAASRWLRAAPSPARAEAPSGLPAGEVPNFRFVDQHGVEHRFSDWRGQTRVVNFWATWCPPCVHEIPILIAVQESFRARGVRFLGVAANEPAEAFAMAKEFGMNYPTMADTRRAVELMHVYGHPSAALPFTAFIDAKDAILARHVGALTLEQAQEKVRLLLS